MSTGLGLIVAAFLLLMAGPAAAASMYFNSSEPGCNGSDPTVLWCEDFQSLDAFGNRWYGKNHDEVGAAGGDYATTKGWHGTIYANSYIPNSSVCGGQGPAGFACAATSGPLPGPNPDNTGNMADHDVGPASGYSTVYFRWYIKYSVGHTDGALKTLTFNKWGAGNGGISIGGFGHGAGPWSMCPVQDCNAAGLMNPQNTGCRYGSNYYLCQNQGKNLDFTAMAGHWLAMQIRITMNTGGGPNGLYQLWIDDCGVNGLGCTGTPTLRASFTNVRWTSGSDLVKSIWIENQSPPPPDGPARGQQWYGPIKVATAGPVGFAGTGTVPPPTASYTLTTATVGAGAVSGAGSYPSGTVVTPVALAAAGSTFSSWSGDCSGTGACTVTMTANKNVTATFTTPTTPPPTGSVPPAPASPTVTLGTTDATGVTHNVSWPAVAGATSYSYTAGLSDNSANLQGTVTPPNMLLKTPYMQNGAAGTGFVCVKSVNAAGSSADAACNGLTVPAKPAVIPPPLTTGTLVVDAQISRCNYFLTAEPPDAAGGWTAQFYRDGSTKVGNPITAAPYKRSAELYAPSHSFSVQFTKTGSVMRSPAVVTRACP